MATQLDVYRDWLGIKDAKRPLNYYQLLRLKQFEDDAGKVREHYRKMNAHVRKYASGEYAKQSQQLLNELSKAMLCLTDAKRKGEYDASLGRTDQAGGKRRSMEEILLARKVIEPDQLAKARNFATAVGVEVRDAIVQQKLAKPEDVMPAYAESIGLPYIDVADILIDKALISLVPAMLARQHTCVPLMVENEQVLIASATELDPNVEEELRLRLNMPVRTVLTAPAELHEVVNKHYTREAAAAEKSAGPAKAQAAKPAAPAPVSKAEKEAQKQAEKQAKEEAKRQAAEAKQAEKANAATAMTADEIAEAKKARISVTVAAFCLTVMIYQLIYQLALNWIWGWPGFYLCFVAGGVAAGIAWIVKRVPT